MALRDMTDQVLDSMELERERGITIKSKAVRLPYTAANGEQYELNLIDTPGHVDFTYEVSRALAACEGAILVVDASQGIEAQTLANVYMALDHDLEILPVINKIDLPSAQPDVVKHEIEDEIGLDTQGCPLISAKQGTGIEQVLEAIVEKVPAPKGDPKGPLQALIFDSYYDNYRGAISSVRIMEGRVSVGDHILLMAGGRDFEVTEVGAFAPGGYLPTQCLQAGDVGSIAASIKDIADIRVGDTIIRRTTPRPGAIRRCCPWCTAASIRRRGGLRGPEKALEKAVAERRGASFERRNQRGAGVRVPVRVPGPAAHGDHPAAPEREFDLTRTTAPSVGVPRVKTIGRSYPDNPTNLPRSRRSPGWRSPGGRPGITPRSTWGAIMELPGQGGTFRDMKYIEGGRVLNYDLPPTK